MRLGTVCDTHATAHWAGRSARRDPAAAVALILKRVVCILLLATLAQTKLYVHHRYRIYVQNSVQEFTALELAPNSLRTGDFAGVASLRLARSAFTAVFASVQATGNTKSRSRCTIA